MIRCPRFHPRALVKLLCLVQVVYPRVSPLSGLRITESIYYGIHDRIYLRLFQRLSYRNMVHHQTTVSIRAQREQRNVTASCMENFQGFRRRISCRSTSIEVIRIVVSSIVAHLACIRRSELSPLYSIDAVQAMSRTKKQRKSHRGW